MFKVWCEIICEECRIGVAGGTTRSGTIDRKFLKKQAIENEGYYDVQRGIWLCSKCKEKVNGLRQVETSI